MNDGWVLFKAVYKRIFNECCIKIHRPACRLYAGNKFFSYKYNETFPVPRNFDKK